MTGIVQQSCANKNYIMLTLSLCDSAFKHWQIIANGVPTANSAMLIDVLTHYYCGSIYHSSFFLFK